VLNAVVDLSHHNRLESFIAARAPELIAGIYKATQGRGAFAYASGPGSEHLQGRRCGPRKEMLQARSRLVSA